MITSNEPLQTSAIPFSFAARLEEEKRDIVVFSHLRWGFVTQRPQHLLNRLSKGRRILFVEEPIPYTEKNRLGFHTIRVSNEITVIQPYISWDAFIDELEPVVIKAMKKIGIDRDPILWFYSPMFVGITERIPCSRIVYDCMDELSAFAGAPASLVNNERVLLSKADIVFTGGKSLYESKKRFHGNVYCFPSSVDRAHFEKAGDVETKLPSDIAAIKPPVAGFYGVLDERLDLGLMDEVAKICPEVSFVYIGPVVKISEASLPKRPNIKYLGQKNYEELPSYLKGFDIAVMPFARNDATKFISPTKTLEFMAAKKPIISTPITDVVRDYSKEVSIVSNAQSFQASIEHYLSETASERRKREALQSAVIERTSWDRTAEMMDEILSTTKVSVKPVDERDLLYSV